MSRLIIVISTLAIATIVFAHRLDECLQAMRVSVSMDQIQFELNITPPHNAAEKFKQVLDDDGDGTIGEKDLEAYVAKVRKDLSVSLDGRPLDLSVTDLRFPSVDQGRRTEAPIQIELTAAMTNLSAGEHQLTLTNQHLPGTSVYQVNAVVPRDKAVSITKQTRNETQSEYQLDFKLTSERSKRVD